MCLIMCFLSGFPEQEVGNSIISSLTAMPFNEQQSHDSVERVIAILALNVLYSLCMTD